MTPTTGLLLSLLVLAAPQPPLRVGGSTTVQPITTVMEAGFLGQARTLRLQLLPSSTGEGLAQLCAGALDAAGASRPIRPDEARACERAGRPFVELPIAFDGLAVVVHRDATWATDLTVPELRRIWAPGSRITRWSDVRKGWPATPLRPLAPAHGSGTRDFFAEALALPRDVLGQPALREDAASHPGGDAVARATAATPGALSFVGDAHYLAHRDTLRLVAVDAGTGPVLPTEDTVRAGTYVPLARPLLLYVSANALAQRPDLASFTRFYLGNALRVAHKVGYTPLPPEAYRLAIVRLEARRPGTVFAGRAVGVSILELLRREGAGADTR